jgi:hypothetical protein
LRHMLCADRSRQAFTCIGTIVHLHWHCRDGLGVLK